VRPAPRGAGREDRSDRQAGGDSDGQADKGQDLHRNAHEARRLVRGLRQADGLAVEEHVVDEARAVGDAEHPASVAPTGSSHAINGCASLSSASAKNISFDRKPLSNGTPAIAALATIASSAVHGMYFHRPFSFRMSRDPVS